MKELRLNESTALKIASPFVQTSLCQTVTQICSDTKLPVTHSNSFRLCENFNRRKKKTIRVRFSCCVCLTLRWYCMGLSRPVSSRPVSSRPVPSAATAMPGREVASLLEHSSCVTLGLFHCWRALEKGHFYLMGVNIWAEGGRLVEWSDKRQSWNQRQICYFVLWRSRTGICCTLSR